MTADGACSAKDLEAREPTQERSVQAVTTANELGVGLCVLPLARERMYMREDEVVERTIDQLLGEISGLMDQEPESGIGT